MRRWEAGDLAPLLQHPDRTAILLDYDGTLAPIVDDPAAALPFEGAREVLATLAGRYLLVAIISGRPARWLLDQVPVPGVERWGSYGLEHVVDGRVEVDAAAAPWRAAVADVLAEALASAPPGVRIEDKGASVTIHVRSAPQHASWARAFAERQAAATGLAIHGAKMSVELRPPVDVDKGVAVRGLIDGAGATAACFIGDDIGDMSAFRALDGLPVALRVAVVSPESPAELLEASDVVVDGPAGVLELLRALSSG